MRKLILLFTLIAFMLMGYKGFTAVTKFLGDSSIKDFEKGKFNRIALDRNGYLSLSPQTKEVFHKDDILYVWCLVEDSKGNFYFGTGNKPRIYRKTPGGKVELFYEFETGITVTSLAIDSKDNLYACANPGNTIVKLKPNGSSKFLAQIKEKYIWKLKIDSRNNLYVATGGSASIYQIKPDASIKAIYKSKEESHFLALSITPQGDVVFGSVGKGIIYKWNRNTNRVKVLYDTYENEIKDILTDSRGNIYFATASKIPKRPPRTFNYMDTFIRYGSAKVNRSKLVKRSKKLPLKNSIYEIPVGGEITKLFTRNNTTFLSLAMDEKGQLYAGTGDEGVIYKVNGVNDASIFIDTKELQVLSLLISHNDKLIASTGNVGKVLEISLKSKNEGTYLSRVFNANGQALWGNISWDVRNAPLNTIQLFTRSGNTSHPDKTWTPWSKSHISHRGEVIKSPSSQYIQYKVLFRSDASGNTPILKKVALAYLLENRTPRIENIRLKKETNKSIPLIGPFSKAMPPSVFTLTWEASDRDYDFLTYTIYFREENSKRWVLLKDKIYYKRFSFDSRRLSDGNYYYKVVATDEKSNGSKRAKAGFGTSSLYKIDNSPPKIEKAKMIYENGVYKIRGIATDKLSMIKIIQYSLNSADWVYLGPQDLIYDSMEEGFEIVIDPKKTPLHKGKNIIIFRVADKFNNFTTHEVTFRTSQAP
ncbi:MAG: hypothetical protein IEMM0008_0372 [bacterium]|nr:MAG: hypothetical protein IEMM0008_0372 [bacterium]